MTRAELEKWFTIYAAKVYANTFHRGIKTTPLARYKEGNLEVIVVPASVCRIALPNRLPSCSTSCPSRSVPFRSTAS
jgi:hypothetical protein